jgi:predicted nucleic acid-binding protein
MRICDMGLTVSDSSTLIHLAGIDRLDLLKVFFGSIALPPAVWREVVEQGRGRAGALETVVPIEESLS